MEPRMLSILAVHASPCATSTLGSRSVLLFIPSTPSSTPHSRGSTVFVADAHESGGGKGGTCRLEGAQPLANSFLLPPQTHASLCLPPSYHPAQRGDPYPCAVHHFSLHRLHRRQPSLFPVHHSCVRSVSLRCLSRCWVCGIRIHRHGPAPHHRQQPRSTCHRLRAVPAPAAAA